MSDKNTNVTCTDKDLDRTLYQAAPSRYVSDENYYVATAIAYAGYMIAKALCSIATAIKESKK